MVVVLRHISHVPGFSKRSPLLRLYVSRKTEVWGMRMGDVYRADRGEEYGCFLPS